MTSYFHPYLLPPARAADLDSHPDFGPLFPDPPAEALRYYRKTNISPINHTVVIRREIAEANPWAVLNILKAFNKANDIANAQRMESIQHYRAAGLIDADTYEALGEPIVQHGIKANRETLEAAALYSFEQSLTARQVALEEVFAESTLDQ